MFPPEYVYILNCKTSLLGGISGFSSSDWNPFFDLGFFLVDL